MGFSQRRIYIINNGTLMSVYVFVYVCLFVLRELLLKNAWVLLLEIHTHIISADILG